MGFAIGVLLLILSAIGTLAAFGGRTWFDNDDPWVKRITARGWVALACLIMATGAGMAKAYLDGERGRVASARLEDQGRAIARQGEELSQARTDLGRQSMANLLTTLSGPNRIVGAQFESPAIGTFQNTTNMGQLLFSELPPAYRPMARINVEIFTPTGTASHVVDYNNSDSIKSIDDLGQEIYTYIGRYGMGINYGIGRMRDSKSNAATGFSELAKGRPVAAFHLFIVKRASTREEITRFDQSHRDLEGYLHHGEEGLEKFYGPPKAFADQIARHVTARMHGSTFSLTMRQPGQEDSPVVIASDVVCAPDYWPAVAFTITCNAHGSPRVEMADHSLR
jgi:hypothetical protein